MQLVTTDGLRALLQLPERPYQDIFPYDGTPYWDLSRREVCRVLTASGTVAAAPHLWNIGVDAALTAGSVDFSASSSIKPDFGSAFTIDYTYSRLGSAAASTAVQYAGLVNTRDLGTAFPWGSTTAEGLNFNDLAEFGQRLLAAHWACRSLATSDIENAEKYRRGTVIIDDTKKSDDWNVQAQKYEEHYKRYLVMLRGPLRAFQTITLNDVSKVFQDAGFFGPSEDPNDITSNLFGGAFF